MTRSQTNRNFRPKIERKIKNSRTHPSQCPTILRPTTTPHRNSRSAAKEPIASHFTIAGRLFTALTFS